MGSPAQGAVSGSFQTTRSTSGPVTHNESVFPLTPTSYTCRILASLPKSKIDRLTPHLEKISVYEEIAGYPRGDKNSSTCIGCVPGTGTIAAGFATVVGCSNSLREVPV